MKKSRVLKIVSTLDEMFRLEQFIEEISDEHLLYGSYYGNILMAVSEAVKNAIIHGNRSDNQKQVRIKEESTKEGLWIRVFDEGEGFDYSAYLTRDGFGMDFSTEKNGLLLIQKLADEVRFQNEGRVIEMLFRINGIDNSIFERRVTFMQDFFRVYQWLNN
jgi:serine/threonine-protein kinase RsbW